MSTEVFRSKKKANFSFFGSKQFSSKSRKKERKRKRKKERKRRVRGRKGAIIRR